MNFSLTFRVDCTLFFFFRFQIITTPCWWLDHHQISVADCTVSSLVSLIYMLRHDSGMFQVNIATLWQQTYIALTWWKLLSIKYSKSQTKYWLIDLKIQTGFWFIVALYFFILPHQSLWWAVKNVATSTGMLNAFIILHERWRTFLLVFLQGIFNAPQTSQCTTAPSL